MNGVSTRKVDRLVEQLGIGGMTKDRVSAMCRGWTSRSRRSASGRWRAPTRTCGWTRSTSRSATVAGSSRRRWSCAYAVHETGVREVIGLDVGEVESGAFWLEFLRGLKRRGLHGVRLAISDPHEGLKAAIARVLACPWQRCTVHFVRDMVMHFRRDQRGLVAAALREIFNAEGRDQAKERVAHVLERLAESRRRSASCSKRPRRT